MKKPTIICMVAFLLGLMVGHAFAQPELKFDYEHGEGTPDDNGSMGVVFYNKTIKLDIYLANWGVRPNVVNMDYYFTRNSTWLSLEDVTVITAEPWDEVHNLPTGVYDECYLGIADLIEGVGPGLGVGGNEIWSHTVELMGIDVPQTAITIGASLNDPAPDYERERDGVILDADGNHWVKGDVLPATGTIHSICKEHSFKCSPEKPCDRWRAGYMCSDEITVPTTNTWELIPDRSFDGTIIPVFCPGEMVHVMHTRLATYPVNTVDPNVPATMCESECFNRDFDDDMVYTETSCNYHCMEEENTGFCGTDCVTITETIAANVAKAAECIASWDGSRTYWNETCGLYFRNIPVTVRQVTANCTGNEMNEEPYPVFSGFGGIGGIKIPLPLNLIPGQQYDICTEFEGERHLVERITIESGCPSVCTLEIPRNPFVVKQGAATTTLEVKMKGPPGTYNLSLRQCADKSCNRELNRPESVQLRASSAIITIPPLPSEETVYVDATGPDTEDNQNYWANIRLEALQTDGPSTCMVTFDYDVTAIAALEDDCEYNDHFLQGDTVCSGRTILSNISPDTYPFHVVVSKDWASNNEIPSSCTNCATPLPFPMDIATDTRGDLQCRTTLWANARADSYPFNNRANFDIVIDVGGDGHFDEGTDILDSFVLHADVDSDGDGRKNFIDNCPTAPNPNQEDNYPPGGNSSPPTDNCGDACECEGDVQSATLGEGYPDGDVDGSDAFVFKENFGRTDCATSPPCLRDYECDSDVDGTDAFKFKEEFGTVGCPSCTFNCLYE